MKTTKRLLLLINLLLINTVLSQTVTMLALTVNGQPVTASAPINLGTNSIDVSVGLSVQVQMPNSPSDNYPGTINIYYRKNTSNPINLAVGGNGGDLLFFGGLVGFRNFMITLQSSQFDATGGIFYAEYQTYTNIKYKSTNLSVIKSSSSGTSGNPPSIVSPYTENIPYGATPILAKVPNPSWGSTFDWVKSNNTYVNTNDVNNVYTQIDYGYNRPITNSTIIYLKQNFNDGTYSFDLNTKFYVNVNMPYRQNQTNPFIFYNVISVNGKISNDQYIPYGTSPQTIIGEPGSITQGLNGPIIPATNYQWQKRIVRPLPEYYNYLTYISLYGWQDIPSATQLNYTPIGNVTELTEYRRLIVQPGNFTQRMSATSDIHTIYPMSTFGIGGDTAKNLNSICCNQNVTGFQTDLYLNPIVGSAFDQNSFSYIWQKEILRRNGTDYYWQNIPFSNTKDFTPYGNRSSIGRKYRRIVVSKTDYKYYFSNEINITYSSSRNNSNFTNTEKINVNIYPNPSNSYINIEGIDISSCSINITDMSGRIMINHELGYYKDIQQIDISFLPIGVYSLNIENQFKKISKKIIKQ